MVEDIDNPAWVPDRVERQAREPAPVGAAPCDRMVRLVGGIAAVVLVLAIALVLFVSAAHWLAHHDIGSAREPLLQAAQVAARGRLLTLGAGLFAAGALLGAAEFTLSQRTQQRSEQVIDRYTRAVARLGSDQLGVRIGGIYALERVARDSASHRPPVMAVLTAFIREYSREQWPPPDPDGRELVPFARPDMQAAVTVVGRLKQQRNSRPIDLTGADLTGADLTGADLTHARIFGARLSSARLPGATLTRADLTRADLDCADLNRANLTRADFTGADLSRANLTRARLFCAGLSCARLPGADLTGADLTGADLTGADLTGADLTRARLFCTDLTGVGLLDALWPKHAPVPGGWKLDTGTGRLAAGTDCGPAEAN